MASFAGSQLRRLSQRAPDLANFKVLIVGDTGTGKTTYLSRPLHLRRIVDVAKRVLPAITIGAAPSGESTVNEERPMSLKKSACRGDLGAGPSGESVDYKEKTNAGEAFQLDFVTNSGNIRFHCFDIDGQEKFHNNRDGYYVHADCAIIMFDVTARLTYKSVEAWHRDISRVCKDIPIVVCGNKVDLGNREVMPRQITYPTKKKLHYCEVSAENNYNWEKPFLLIAKDLKGDPNLQFLESPALAPPSGTINMAAQRLLEAQLPGASTHLRRRAVVDLVLRPLRLAGNTVQSVAHTVGMCFAAYELLARDGGDGAQDGSDGEVEN